jgi:hypothetical protein
VQRERGGSPLPAIASFDASRSACTFEERRALGRGRVAAQAGALACGEATAFTDHTTVARANACGLVLVVHARELEDAAAPQSLRHGLSAKRAPGRGREAHDDHHGADDQGGSSRDGRPFHGVIQ